MVEFITKSLSNIFTPADLCKTLTTLWESADDDGSYDDLIVTTVKLEPAGENRVSFSSTSGNTDPEATAAFLKDITFDSKTNKFTATSVSKQDAADIAKKGYEDSEDHTTLFCVHGCCGTLEQQLFASRKGRDNFKNSGGTTYMIPVVWATKGQYVLGYKSEFETRAPEAGEILARLANDITDKSFGKVSLLCHSMGNHVMFNSSGLQKKLEKPPEAPTAYFENIFMVAADVPNDIFSSNPRQTFAANDFNFKEKKADNIKEMLAPGGKIYILHTDIDTALLTSSKIFYWFRLFQPRIGTTGATSIRKNFDGTVINVDVTSWINDPETQKVAVEKLVDHLYVYDTWAVDFYNYVHGKEVDQETREKYETLMVNPTVDSSWRFPPFW